MDTEKRYYLTESEHLLCEFLKRAKHVVVLTGAGMSTESGIPDFRSYQGLWTQNQELMEVMSIDFYRAQPETFWQAFKDVFRLKIAGDYRPNRGHEFLAWLEQQGKRVSIVTQNIDGLHGAAGSSQVLEAHGSLRHYSCESCYEVHDLEHILQEDIPKCRKCNTILRPDVVLYGEAVTLFDEAVAALETADLLLVLGSSLEVGPINLLPVMASRAGLATALINFDRTSFDKIFDIKIHASIGETLEKVRRSMEEIV